MWISRRDARILVKQRARSISNKCKGKTRDDCYQMIMGYMGEILEYVDKGQYKDITFMDKIVLTWKLWKKKRVK